MSYLVIAFSIALALATRSASASFCSTFLAVSNKLSARLFETSNLGICGAEIDEEVVYHHVVTTCAAGGECGAQRLDGAREGAREGMLERRAAPALHEEILG
jgi:hypothetical protein